MRLNRFVPHDADEPRVGVHLPEENRVIDLSAASERLNVSLPSGTRALLSKPDWRDVVESTVGHACETGAGLYGADEVSFRAPVGEPQKIVCVGLNYAEHVEEGDQEVPEDPLLFSKFATSLVGPNEEIVWDPQYTEEVDYEVELAAVVGDQARHVSPNEAMSHLAGFTVANDVSARDLQFADDQWVRGKSLDTFCPLGPDVVTIDEFDDPHNLPLWTEVNGERVQESTTADLIFDVPELVSFCSDAFTLLPGDIILTGTPPGVGVFREPRVLLEDGDEVTVAVDGIGKLTNGCRYK